MSGPFFETKSPHVYLSTENTRGPWSRDSQHGGPPCALLGHALDTLEGGDDMRIARITFEILRPVPVAELRVEARVARPGRKVQLLEGSLYAEDEEIMRARGWRIRVGQIAVEPRQPDGPAPELPDVGDASMVFHPGWTGYLDAMEWRFAKGGFMSPGPATVWARMRGTLVDDEPPAPLTRVLVLADSGSGASAELDFQRWLFINPDLTVYLHAEPRSEWICLDAASTIQPDGIGMAASVIYDEHGPVGRGLQSLLIAPRE